MNSDLIKKIVPLVVFFVVANPETFKLTRSVAGGWIANSYGLPTTAGLLLHALVFVIVAHFLSRLVFGGQTSYGIFSKTSKAVAPPKPRR
jgi:hypothetical protein